MSRAGRKIHVTWKPVANGAYDFYHDGEWLGRSGRPFTDAARLLVASGVAGTSDKLTGGPTPQEENLSCTVGTAAKLTVEESDLGGLRFRLWKPYPGREAAE